MGYGFRSEALWLLARYGMSGVICSFCKWGGVRGEEWNAWMREMERVECHL